MPETIVVYPQHPAPKRRYRTTPNFVDVILDSNGCAEISINGTYYIVRVNELPRTAAPITTPVAGYGIVESICMNLRELFA